MSYKWKKALANAGAVFLGVIVVRVGDGNVPTSLDFWKHTVVHAASITALTEIRYVYAWLSTLGNGAPPQPPKAGG